MGWVDTILLSYIECLTWGVFNQHDCKIILFIAMVINMVIDMDYELEHTL